VIWAYSKHRKEEKYIRGFDGESWRKKLLGRPTHRWNDNIRRDIIEIG